MLLVAVFISTGAYATKVPIPIEGASLNILVQVQAQALVNQASTPDGLNPSFDVFIRRTRLLATGDISPSVDYLFQVDNANFGKYGNYAVPRAIVQDAWIGWSPTGFTGGTMLSIDAGILLVPISRHMLQSTTNFITADAMTDAFRFPGNPTQAFRDTGVQIRGWILTRRSAFAAASSRGTSPSTSRAASPAWPGRRTPAPTPSACRRCADSSTSTSSAARTESESRTAGSTAPTSGPRIRSSPSTWPGTTSRRR
jgi:hypothetical protein